MIDAAKDRDGPRRDLWDFGERAIELTACLLERRWLVAARSHREDKHGHRLKLLAMTLEKPSRVAVQTPAIERATHHDASVLSDIARSLTPASNLDLDTLAAPDRRDRLGDLTSRSPLRPVNN
jgi:hypothetical protein